MNGQHVSASRNGSTTSGRKRAWLLGCAGVVGLTILVACLFVRRMFPAGHHIGALPEGERYASTRFEFRYGHATRVIDDPENQMQWVYGEMPDSITVTNGTRLIIYNGQKAVIKSRRDSMDAHPDSLQHGGYLGMWSRNINFVVDHDGVIQPR